MKRVLVITYYWPPAGGAGVQRWLKMCKYLPENGVMPTVITVNENKASYPQRDESFLKEVHSDIEVIRTNSFEPLAWYARLFGKEKVPYGGFANVSRKGLFSKISRYIRGNFFIPDARLGWKKYALQAAKLAIAKNNISLIITTGPPHSAHLVGLALKKELGIKWIADFQDPWTDIYYNDLLHRTERSKQKDSALEKQVLDSADLVVTNCNSNVELLSGKGGRAPFKVVEVGFDAADFRQSEVVKGETFNIVYTGTMAASYNPAVFINAFKNLVKVAPDSVKWHIAGMLDPEIVALIEAAGLTKHCVMYGYIPHHQAVELMSKAHVLLSIFPQTKNELGIPGKLFEYLAAHRTILNIAPKSGDSSQIIAECESGITFERHEVNEVIEFLNQKFLNWQEGNLTSSGNENVLKYARHQLAKRFAEIIYSVI